MTGVCQCDRRSTSRILEPRADGHADVGDDEVDRLARLHAGGNVHEESAAVDQLDHIVAVPAKGVGHDAPHLDVVLRYQYAKRSGVHHDETWTAPYVPFQLLPRRAADAGSGRPYAVAFCDMLQHAKALERAISGKNLDFEALRVGPRFAQGLDHESSRGRADEFEVARNALVRARGFGRPPAPRRRVRRSQAARGRRATDAGGDRDATGSGAITSPAEPTRGTIAISDEIRTACGIPAKDALFAFDSATLE